MSKEVIKIVHGGRTLRHELSATPTFGSFISHISNMPNDGGVELSHIQLFIGFPPTLVKAYASAPLIDCGISAGMTVTVRGGSSTSYSLLGSAKADVKSKIEFEYVWKQAMCVCNGGEGAESGSDLMEEMYEQLLQAADSATTEGHSSVGAISASSSLTTGTNIIGNGGSCDLTAKRVIVPADNSCLFHAVGFLLEHSGAEVEPPAVQSAVQQKLRSIVAEEVIRKRNLYSESVLGMTQSAYSSWIRDSSHWGGEIEIAVLCSHYLVGIRVVDVGSGCIFEYSPLSDRTECSRCIYLLYDGIHYDALVVTGRLDSGANTDSCSVFQFEQGTPADSDHLVKVFDNAVMKQHVARIENLFKELASRHKAAGEYTNLLSNDTCIQCMVCFKNCTGEVGATRHALATKHQNFRQI